jgi:hypothetical protein
MGIFVTVAGAFARSRRKSNNPRLPPDQRDDFAVIAAGRDSPPLWLRFCLLNLVKAALWARSSSHARQRNRK